MLNERQEKLYAYLLEKSITGKYVSKEEISKDLPDLYPRKFERSTEHNSNVYATLRGDIRRINQSEVDKIVCSSPKGYKIPNSKEEARTYIERRFKRDLSSLKINWNLKKKLADTGQLEMVDEDIFRVIKGYLGG